MDVNNLSQWFIKNKRELPWRKNPSPYHVLVSEVMLQQTQVNVVLDYYQRWMKVFPTLDDLAKAPLEVVIKIWEGLGYYSRARRLHQAACYIKEHFQSHIPSEYEQLISIKGIGPYTAGALLSFAFHQKKAAVDGNVLRVIARLNGIEEDISKACVVKKITTIVENALPETEPWVAMEALIELGALVCKKKPECFKCPLKKECRAFNEGLEGTIPFKKKGESVIKLTRQVFLIESGGQYLVRYHQEQKLMQGLYEFPYYTIEKETFLQTLPSEFLELIPSSLEFMKEKVDHSFTRYQVRLFPYSCTVSNRLEIKGYQWIDKKVLAELPFSSGHRKILSLLYQRV